jgi:hypothetical protein
VCESVVKNNNIDVNKTFLDSFDEEMSNLDNKFLTEEKMISDMKKQGVELANLIIKALNLKFSSYEVISAEEEIYEKIKEFDHDYDYKGFLDLVIRRKHNIDPKMVETYFGLLKRTAKKNRIEIFRVTSGERKTNNSLKVLNKALYNIYNKNHPKNRLKCDKCEFNKTEWCK